MQLKALTAIYKALCVLHEVPAYPRLLADITSHVEDGKALDRLLFCDPCIGAGASRVCASMLQAYPHVNTLCFWACSVHDEGLTAMADLLRAGADPWYKGSRLLALEITADKGDQNAAAWYATPLSLHQAEECLFQV